MHDFFFFYSPEMCCHKNVCDLRLKKWKCRGDLWNVSLFRGVFYYLHRACLHIQHSLSPLLMPGTAHSTHTHTPQSCVLIVDKMWYKRHIPQLSPLMVEGALIANIILIHSYMSARNTPVTDLPGSSLICNNLHHRSHDNATRCSVPETGVQERQVTAASDSHSWVRLRKITRCG